MPSDGSKAVWSSLTELLDRTVKELAAHRADSAKACLSDFIRRSDDAGYVALSQTVQAQARFFQRYVLPRWDDEAAATLDFSMGALLEKMQQESPGTEFNADLNEMVSFLDEFEDEEEVETPDDPRPSGQGVRDEDSSSPEELSETGGLSRDQGPREPLMNREAEREFLHAACPHASESAANLDPDPYAGEETCDYVIDRVDWYKELLREDPSSILFCEIAEELCTRGLWQDAIKTLREGLHYHPRHVRGHALLGWALWEYGSAEQAENMLDRVRNELEKSAIAYRVLGEIATHRGDMEEAERFEAIYSLMKRGANEPEVPWLHVSLPSGVEPGGGETQGLEETAPAAVQEPEGTKLMGFLEALMHRICAAGDAELRGMTVFTSEDRATLEMLIHAQAGDL